MTWLRLLRNTGVAFASSRNQDQNICYIMHSNKLVSSFAISTISLSIKYFLFPLFHTFRNWYFCLVIISIISRYVVIYIIQYWDALLLLVKMYQILRVKRLDGLGWIIINSWFQDWIEQTFHPLQNYKLSTVELLTFYSMLKMLENSVNCRWFIIWSEFQT